jgi:hypothetical protein
MAATLSGKSLNAWVTDQLESGVKKNAPKINGHQASSGPRSKAKKKTMENQH